MVYCSVPVRLSLLNWCHSFKFQWFRCRCEGVSERGREITKVFLGIWRAWRPSRDSGRFLSPRLSSRLSNKIKFTSNSVHICVCENVNVFMCQRGCITHSGVGMCVGLLSQPFPHTLPYTHWKLLAGKRPKLYHVTHALQCLWSFSTTTRRDIQNVTPPPQKKSTWSLRVPCKLWWNWAFNPIYMERSIHVLK